ncbi:MAG: triose-phosphate isomerase [Hyphomicrobium sp.]|jgi:triosephosphate isomerase|uniref:triose-phosphate isomerase n=1 Tax=Hyphomicrobium sp. TaxID=82 RepID=UPI0025BAA1CF|nr:triose-phosphate isomerase [Hyphomicrobium sp.]MBX9862835.1 triose-phosphate isomerase [Hyphomicrobium sp.]
MTDEPIRVRSLVAGNWKMNGLEASLNAAAAVRDALPGLGASAPDVMICPPATLLTALAAVAAGSTLAVGAQDCHTAASGAHTGDISAEMVKDTGASAVIVGHSERRADHGELDRIVRDKAAAAHRAGLTAIVCIGETKGERLAGLTLDVVRRQLRASIPPASTAANLVVAYEPVWAIGTGLTPKPADVAEVHDTIRKSLIGQLGETAHGVRILYGGSVKPDNARELLSLPHVNGALVGGASLKADDFLAIIRAA